MEDVGAVAVNVDAGDLFGEDVAGDVVSFFDDQYFFTGFRHLVRECRSVESGAYYKIIIHAFFSGNIVHSSKGSVKSEGERGKTTHARSFPVVHQMIYFHAISK